MTLVAAACCAIPCAAGEEDPDPLAAANAAWVANRKVEALEIVSAQRVDGGRAMVVDGLRSMDPPVVQASLRALRAVPSDDPDDADLARSHLEHREHPTGLEAIRTAMALDDDRAVPALIALANGDDAACRAAAADAVRALVPVDLPVQRERWAAWHATDQAAAMAAMDHLESVADRQGPELATLLRSASGLRNHRSLVAERISPFLGHRDPEIAGLARQVLRGLRGPVAMAILATAPEPARPAATRPIAVVAVAAPAPEGWTLPAWVSATWLVPVGIVVAVAVLIVLAGLPAGRKVRLGTARLVRSVGERPGLAGKTARLVRSGGDLAGKTARLTRRLVRKITWGGH